MGRIRVAKEGTKVSKINTDKELYKMMGREDEIKSRKVKGRLYELDSKVRDAIRFLEDLGYDIKYKE